MIRPNSRLLTAEPDARLWLTASIGLGALGGALLVWQAWLLTLIIDGVFIRRQGLADVEGLIGLLGGVILARALVSWGADTAAGRSAAIAKRGLRDTAPARLPIRIMNTGISGAVTSSTAPDSRSLGKTVSRIASGTSAASASRGRYCRK